MSAQRGCRDTSSCTKTCGPSGDSRRIRGHLVFTEVMNRPHLALGGGGWAARSWSST
jgi:hypothetical protein